MRARKAAVVFIFITVTLDMLALGLIAPVLPKLVLDFLGGEMTDAAKWSARFAVVWEDDQGRLAAPPLALGILPSVGRARLHQLSGGIVEQAVERGGLDGRAVALVNAVRGVVPIASLDGTKVPQSALLERLAERFWP